MRKGKSALRHQSRKRVAAGKKKAKKRIQENMCKCDCECKD